MGSHLTWNFAHCVYILASSSCLYKIYFINKVSTESRLLISAFYYIVTCNLRKNSWRSVEQIFVLPARWAIIRVWRHVKTINWGCWTFTPPTDNSCRTWDLNPQLSDYKSDFLTIRPRLSGVRGDRRSTETYDWPIRIKHSTESCNNLI